MQFIPKKLLVFFVSICAVLIPGLLTASGYINEGDEYREVAHTVMVILESKQGKEELLKNALMKVAEKSRQEDSCLEYRFYQDQENPHRFGLYEKWKSKELHQQQFTKPYIADFAKQAESLLEKPFEAIFGEEVTH